MQTNPPKMNEEEHKAYHRRVGYIIVLLLIILFGGALFYHYVEKWRYIDSFYFVSATLTTIGYGDITPKTDFGKLFTIFYMFAGVGIALYGLSLMASHFVEVREEFWLQRFGKIRLIRTRSFLEKIKDMFSYKEEKLVDEYEKSTKHKGG